MNTSLNYVHETKAFQVDKETKNGINLRSNFASQTLNNVQTSMTKDKKIGKSRDRVFKCNPPTGFCLQKGKHKAGF